jgi:uncharacterized membrane protein
MDPVLKVVLGWLLFAGTHTLLSHPPVRDRLVARLGDRGFLGLYSLVAFATFIPLCWSFFAGRTATVVPLPLLARVPGLHWVTMALMFVALLLIVLGVAKPSPVSELMARGAAGATGAVRITRHPLFMGVGLAAAAHLLVNPAPIDRAFFGGMALYAVIGCAHQDWRKRRAGDPALGRLFEETSFLPFAAILTGRNRLVWRELPIAASGAAVALYLLVFFLHHRVFG